MRRRIRFGMIGLATALLLAVPAPAQSPEADDAEENGLTVARIAICRAVEDREPVDEGTRFPADVGRLYCFTKITGAGGETSVTHVWYHGEQERARVALRVGAAAWRTWSSKRLWHTWTGDWRVVVEDADGAVLTEQAFTVTEAANGGEE